MDERDEQPGSESEDEYGSSGSESGEDASSESEEESGSESGEDSSSEEEGESPQEFLDRIGAQDHYDEVTSQINPSDDPSLLNEDNKHYYTARALGVRRGMREGDLDGDEAFGTLSGVVGGQLDDIGVPVPDYSADAQYGEGEGMTNYNPDGSASIAVSPDDFSGQELGREAVSALYHESVHAEQWSLVTDVRDGTDTDPSSRVARLVSERGPANRDALAQTIQGAWADPDSDSYAAYQSLPSEQEAYQADGDVGDMYERVGAMHDELEGQERGSPMGAVDELEERLEAQRQEILQGTPEQARLEGEYAQPEGAQ